MRRSVRALRSAFAMQITGPSWRAPIRRPLWIAPGRALRPSGSNEGPCARLLLFTPPVLAHQRLLHSRWHGLVVRQRNGVAALAAGHRMQPRLVVGQLAPGHLAADGHGTAALAGGAGDEAAPRRQVARDIAHRMLGHGDLDLHDRFEHGRTGLADRGHKGLATGGREGDVLAVDAVVLAVVHHDAHVDHGVAGDRAVGQHLAHAFLDRRDELARDRAAPDFVGEREARAAPEWLDAQEDFGELAGTAALLLVAVVALGRRGHGLAVGDAR